MDEFFSWKTGMEAMGGGESAFDIGRGRRICE